VFTYLYIRTFSSSEYTINDLETVWKDAVPSQQLVGESEENSGQAPSLLLMCRQRFGEGTFEQTSVGLQLEGFLCQSLDTCYRVVMYGKCHFLTNRS
jgi:hypothetical protein